MKKILTRWRFVLPIAATAAALWYISYASQQPDMDLVYIMPIVSFFFAWFIGLTLGWAIETECSAPAEAEISGS